MGKRVAARRDVFPAGANLSVLLPLGPAEVFVRTFERGAGLTASCGSGMAASRAVYSCLGRADPERSVVVRNAGGMAAVSLRVAGGQWFPVLEGNATFVYRTAVDPSALARGLSPAGEREPYPDEVRAYSAFDEQNAGRLRAAGLEVLSRTARPASAASPSRSPRLADRQHARAHRDVERPARRDHLAVDLARQVAARADLDAACLVARQLTVLVPAAGQD